MSFLEWCALIGSIVGVVTLTTIFFFGYGRMKEAMDMRVTRAEFEAYKLENERKIEERRQHGEVLSAAITKVTVVIEAVKEQITDFIAEYRADRRANGKGS